jgi:hypothetical protein
LELISLPRNPSIAPMVGTLPPCPISAVVSVVMGPPLSMDPTLITAGPRCKVKNLDFTTEGGCAILVS